VLIVHCIIHGLCDFGCENRDLYTNNAESKIQYSLSDNSLTFTSNESIGGIQITTSGVYRINPDTLPVGWVLSQNTNRILIYDLERISAVSSLTVNYDGNIQIEDIILTDPTGLKTSHLTTSGR